MEKSGVLKQQDTDDHDNDHHADIEWQAEKIPVLRDHLERGRQVRERRVADDGQPETLISHPGAHGDNDGEHLKLDDKDAIDQTKQDTAAEPGENCDANARARFQYFAGDERAAAHHRADGEVRVAADERNGQPDGDDHVQREPVDNDQKVARAQKIGGSKR
ncbi:hypothetical protein SDC9_78032 [bioreactor metagenome]|uniref:Uncharacterized protein n=1 Tax=bioreactor metagenome TaxID=1076179 RepID=A0A644YT38_9ZZZZ